MATPRPTSEALYDSAATLRLVDTVLDDLQFTPAPAAQMALNGIAEIPQLLLRAYAEINSVLSSLRQSRDVLERTTVEKLQHTHQKLAEVTSATEVAATDILDGLDRALAMVDRLDGEAVAGDTEAAAGVRTELRDELFGLMGCLQFQDITSQQLSYAASVLHETEQRLQQLARVFDPQLFGLEPVVEKGAAPRLVAFDPAATTADAEHRQALVDEIFGR